MHLLRTLQLFLMTQRFLGSGVRKKQSEVSGLDSASQETEQERAIKKELVKNHKAPEPIGQNPWQTGVPHSDQDSLVDFGSDLKHFNHPFGCSKSCC